MAELFAPRRLLASRWFDPALAIALTTVCLVELFSKSELRDTPRAVIVVILLGATIAVRRTHPVAAACAQAAVFLANPNYDENFLPAIGPLLPVILAYSCGAHAPLRRGLLGVAALTAGMQVGTGFSEFPNVEIAFLTLGPWWIGSQLGQRRRLLSDLAERAAELEAEQDAFARLSVRRERARIAHELHDIVAHHLAVIVVQAGAGRLSPGGPADEAAGRLVAIRQAGAQALAEMARLVDILEADKQDGATGLSKLRVLLDQANARGLDIRYTPPSSGAPLSAEVEDAAYRIAREGLTNAIKHAPGAAVDVRLDAHDDHLEIEVGNAAARAASSLAATGSGLGLSGMRDRVESLGGTLEAGPGPHGGWRLAARLPVAVPAGR